MYSLYCDGHKPSTHDSIDGALALVRQRGSESYEVYNETTGDLVRNSHPVADHLRF